MRAPAHPVTASATVVAAIVTAIRAEAGARMTAIRGNAAPTVNEAAEAPAAWSGRACESSVMPSSSRACTCSRSCRALSSAATCSASRLERPRLQVDRGQLLLLALGVTAELVSARRARSARSASACELTETYSPAAIEAAPATSPATRR